MRSTIAVSFAAASGLISSVAAQAVPLSETIAVCNELFAAYPKQVAWDPLGPNGLKSFGNTNLYNTANTNYWNEANSLNRAACTFFPGSAQQVSFAVKSLNKHSTVPYALQSGGHNPNLGYSSTNNGVLISFRPNLASTTISADRSTADVGPGSRWDEALETLKPYNKAIVGGRLGHVGVAGYVLGGGLSFLTEQYGFAAENCVNYELVLADGTITNANSTSNQDLFWALKGGGNQFGIVTKFTLKTHPIGQVWGGYKQYDGNSYYKQVMSATSNFITNNKDPKAAVIVTFSFLLSNIVQDIVIFFFYDGATPPAGIFDEFDAIPSFQSSISTQSYADLLSGNNAFSLQGLRYQIREATYPNMPHDNMTAFLEHYYEAYRSYAFQQSLTALDIQAFSFSIQPIPVGISQASTAAGGNRMNLDAANGDRIFMEHDLSWVNPTCDSKCPGLVEDITTTLQNYQKTTYRGVKPTKYQSGDLDYISYNPIFMNDGMYDQNVLQSYGASTYSQLKAIQLRRDPTGFFSTRQGGFKFTT